MMIIAIANQKGGTGKTTTAVNLGAALAELGHPCLLVDCDPQANATVALGLDYLPCEHTTADLLRGAAPSVALRTIRPNLDLVPAHPDILAAAAMAMSPERGDQVLLSRSLRSEPTHSFVLLDCPPSLSLLTIAALIAADRVLVPVVTEYLSLDGVAQLLDTVDAIRDRFNPELAILGLLATRHEPRHRAARSIAAHLDQFGCRVFQTTIRRAVAICSAPAAGLSVLEYAPDSPGAADYRSLAQEVLDIAQ